MPFSVSILSLSVLLHLLAGNAASSTFNDTPSNARSDTTMNSLPHAADTQSKRRPANTRTIPSRKIRQTKSVAYDELRMIDEILAGGDSPIRRGAARYSDSAGSTIANPRDENPWPLIPGLGLGPIKPAPIRPVLISPPEPRDIMLINDSGFRSTESILRILRHHVSGFQYSYEKTLREHPKVRGDILLEFAIAPSGDIVVLHVVSSTTKNPSLDDDIKEKVRRMKFDVIERGNVFVRYTLKLGPARTIPPKKPHKPTRPPM